MPYVIALISSLAGLVWALNSLQRSGISLDSLNPFLAYRRWKWSKEFGSKPLYKLSDPIDIASVLLFGVAKCRGELGGEQKRVLKQIFVEHFKQSPDQADDLLVSASFLTREEVYIANSVERILERTRRQFTTEQKVSLLNLMREVAAVDGAPNAEQNRLLDSTFTILNRK